MKRLGLILLLALAGVGCGTSHDGTTDAGADGGGIVFDIDGSLPDAGPTAAELCGNGVFDVTEHCDDGNTEPGDGCDAECQLESHCGDNVTDDDEVCDDGNHVSGDGCRSDCLSDETCSNDIVDYAAGEVCDGSAACADDCFSLTTCGDDAIDDGETCDDGNTDPWDGCSPGCQLEPALIINQLTMSPASEGCDLDGNGTADNEFSRSLGLLGTFLGPQIQGQIDGGQLNILLAAQGLEDLLGANDDDFRIAWLTGVDVDDVAENNLEGEGQFYVDPNTLDESGHALTSVQSQVASNALTGGPENIPIPTGFLPLELHNGTIEGTTVADSGELYQINNGRLCGGIPISILSVLGGLGGGGFITIEAPSCDGAAAPTIVDLVVGGGRATIMGFPVTFPGVAPDMDLDGDGLEGIEMLTEGPEGCQPVVAACVDGDGTRIEGRDCLSDPAIQDGYSTALEYAAINAELMGITPPDAPAPTPAPTPAP